MTRLEPLVATALGRSPYDEEIILNEDLASPDPGVVRSGQQYDERGRPMNPEAIRHTKDVIRASNEVLHAAHIVEPDSGDNAPDEAARARRDRDIQNAYRKRAHGQFLLSTGIWGTCGLRRRAQLYRGYGNHPLLSIIRSERAAHSIPHMLGAGLPAILIDRAIANVAHVYKHVSNISSSISRRVIYYGLQYIIFHYKYYAILQQLSLVSSRCLVPPLLFMIPFSSQSPLYMPPLPPSFSGASIFSWLLSVGQAIAPYMLLASYGRISVKFMSAIYEPLYQTLPHPSNIRNLTGDLDSALNELHQTILQEGHAGLPHPRSSDLNNTALSSSSDDSASEPGTHLPDPVFSAADGIPTSDERTLSALEGRTTPPAWRVRDSHMQRHDSFDTAPEDTAPPTLISFEIEPTEVRFDAEGVEEQAEAMNSYSAELRNAEADVDAHRAIHKLYNVTALSLLPAHLAADGLSVLLTAMVTMPLEALTMRAIGQGWRAKLGLGSADLPPMLTMRETMSWRGVANIATLFAMDAVITGAVWGVYMAGVRMWDWKEDSAADKPEAAHRR